MSWKISHSLSQILKNVVTATRALFNAHFAYINIYIFALVCSISNKIDGPLVFLGESESFRANENLKTIFTIKYLEDICGDKVIYSPTFVS